VVERGTRTDTPLDCTQVVVDGVRLHARVGLIGEEFIPVLAADLLVAIDGTKIGTNASAWAQTDPQQARPAWAI
jgi:hypothetical protein